MSLLICERVFGIGLVVTKITRNIKTPNVINFTIYINYGAGIFLQENVGNKNELVCQYVYMHDCITSYNLKRLLPCVQLNS